MWSSYNWVVNTFLFDGLSDSKLNKETNYTNNKHNKNKTNKI